MITRHQHWAVAASVAASLVLVPSASGNPAPRWEPCAGNPAVECATVPVPVDWADPGGERFDLAVARRPARGEPVGTLVYLPAGPGSSGVDAVTDDALFELLFSAGTAERFDVVGFDPRGVRRSNPVLCSPELVAALDRPTPSDQREFDDLLAAQAALGADCRERTGPVFDHLDSTQVAGDVDALRAALGEESVNLYALSYGTVVGQRYAELFPGRIRTVVLDGVFDHTVDSDRFALAGARAAQGAFEVFLEWCDRARECALHGQDVRARVADLFDRAERGGLPDPDDPARPLDPAGLTYLLVSPLTRPDLPEVAARIAWFDAPAQQAAPVAPTAAPSPVPLPIYLQCADNRNDASTFARAEALRAASRAVAPDVRQSAYDLADLCVNPPVPATNPQRPLEAGDAPPVLLLNARHDPSTPHEGARNVADQLPGSVLVTHEGLGHGVATRTPCAVDAVHRYLTERVLPQRDAHCPAG
ncbi:MULTISPECIES: alpha/beta hydrolase [Actinosynnema]|uniref:alpha/beta hydrolase n=1 Tax=Actinosynnema TaxID=40566 RepID=UPI0020A37D35|nr:alpha/beta hydrolase [Actinosynnema pretiosum]MCP2098842.1 TAP-like protein [Actinosynnema pretiosum]